MRAELQATINGQLLRAAQWALLAEARPQKLARARTYSARVCVCSGQPLIGHSHFKVCSSRCASSARLERAKPSQKPRGIAASYKTRAAQYRAPEANSVMRRRRRHWRRRPCGQSRARACEHSKLIQTIYVFVRSIRRSAAKQISVDAQLVDWPLHIVSVRTQTSGRRARSRYAAQIIGQVILCANHLRARAHCEFAPVCARSPVNAPNGSCNTHVHCAMRRRRRRRRRQIDATAMIVPVCANATRNLLAGNRRPKGPMRVVACERVRARTRAHWQL